MAKYRGLSANERRIQEEKLTKKLRAGLEEVQKREEKITQRKLIKQREATRERVKRYRERERVKKATQPDHRPRSRRAKQQLLSGDQSARQLPDAATLSRVKASKFRAERNGRKGGVVRGE